MRRGRVLVNFDQLRVLELHSNVTCWSWLIQGDLSKWSLRSNKVTKNECIHVDKSGPYATSPSWETNQTKTWLSLRKSFGKGYILYPFYPLKTNIWQWTITIINRGCIFKSLFLLISCLDFFLLWSWILLILPSTPFQSNVDTPNICIQEENTTSEFHHFGVAILPLLLERLKLPTRRYPNPVPSPTRNFSAWKNRVILGELRSQWWCFFLLNEELKNPRILKITG